MNSPMTSRTHPRAVETPAVIRPLVGEFADGALEQAFRESTLAYVAAQQRFSLVVWAVLMLVGIGLDYLFFGSVLQFWVLASYHVVIGSLLFAGSVAVKRTPTLALTGRMLMWLGLLCYPFFFCWTIWRADILPISIALIMLLQVALFLFLPWRVKVALPVALFGAVGTSLSVWAISSNWGNNLLTAFLVVVPAVVGYVFALRLQKTERQEFWLRRQWQDANSELQGEIARRIALQTELEHQAATDLLTGLPNRRACVTRLTAELARVQRSGEALSLSLFDLDHFKQVNDRYGHAVGDAVLRSVGQLCAHSFRGEDMAARIGGEEFLVLLPGSTAEQAQAVMGRFVSALAGLEIDIGTQTLRVTATAGVVQQAGESLDALMAHVDAVMYAGKQAGRNRVVVATPAVGAIGTDDATQIRSTV